MIHKFQHFKTRFFETFGKVASYFFEISNFIIIIIKYDQNGKGIMVFKFYSHYFKHERNGKGIMIFKFYFSPRSG
jgi:hypothetical protein